MFWLLLWVRLQSLWNVGLDRARRHTWLGAGFVLGGLGLFAGIYVAFGLLFMMAPDSASRADMAYDVFYFLFLFMLAGAVPFVAATLLQSGDYQLLAAAPIHPRTIIASKLLDAAVTNSLQFTVIGIPAIVVCADALDVRGAGWLAVLLLVVLFILLPALLTAALLLAALAAFGMRRVRRAIMAVNALMATTVCLTMVSEANRLPLHRPLQSMFTPAIAQVSPIARLGPSGWVARGLIDLANGDLGAFALGVGRVALLVAALFAACTVLGGHATMAAALEQEEAEGGRERYGNGHGAPNRRGLLAAFPAPVAALVAKDVRYIVRDNVLLSQVGMPIILFLVPVVLLVQGYGRSIMTPMEVYPFAVVMTGVIIFMQTSILSLSAIGLENRGFWLVLASPNGAARLLGAKFAMSTLISGGVGVTLTVLSALAFRAPWQATAIQCAIFVVAAAALCGMGVGISGALPRFVYENPAHRVSVWALILGFCANMLYVFAAGLLAAAAIILPVRAPEHATTVYLACAGVFLAISLGAILVPMAIGIRRISTYQWEH